MTAQQTQTKEAKPKSANTKPKMATENQPPQGIPEHEIKQNSGVTASMALQAAQKAWELRQAANAAGDPDAREKILAKAINKEIEAESFGKAAKYTRSGAFQGLAAGAGLGVQPGVTIGKLTGALVGGVVSTVTGLLGGGIGSVYGAMNGPFWDLGEMASHGVRGVIGDFPNWKSTPAQQKALEKMVMQAKETQAPTQEELEQMKAEAPDQMPQTWSQRTSELTSWRPSMPSMPSMPSAKGAGAALGLGGLGASMPSWGGGGQQQAPAQVNQQQPAQDQSQRPKPATRQPWKEEQQKPQEPSKPKEAPTPKEAPQIDKTQPPKTTELKKASTSQASPKPAASSTKTKSDAPKQAAKPQAITKPAAPAQSKQTMSNAEKENKAPAKTEAEKKKPRKLAPKESNAKPSQTPAVKKAPRKLESRKSAA